MQPAHFGVCGHALDEELVEGWRDVFGDFKGIELPKESGGRA